ncbi:MAG: 4a-hydroxytetrahydrobiopterin dehydratase [Proteobacteria bacterium]|nr:4a-hydroxytetrahydrobiopterin dehydratase [Burkholderiales bacterium]
MVDTSAEDTIAPPLTLRHCRPRAREAALSAEMIAVLLEELPEWRVEGGVLTRLFAFGDYRETIAFVNASAWISQREDHHPELHVGYNRCQVQYVTHEVGGLSENDFICAAMLDALLARG